MQGLNICGESLKNRATLFYLSISLQQNPTSMRYEEFCSNRITFLSVSNQSNDRILPFSPIRTLEHAVGLVVSNDLLLISVPADAAADFV